MLRKALLLTVSAALLTLWSVPAGATNENQAAVLFLLIEPGARVAGMGKSFVTISDDATASYYNPAGLAGQRGRELTAMYTPWLSALGFNDIYYVFLGYSDYLEKWGNIGLSFAYFSLGENIRTDEFGNKIGEFQSFDLALAVSYGGFISRNLAGGVTAKVIRSQLAERGAGQEKGKGTGSSFAADFGIIYYAPFLKGFKLGAAVRNLGPKISYIDVEQADPLPMHVVVGASYKIIDTEYNDLLAVLDIYKPLVKPDASFLEALVTAWTDEDMKREIEQIDFHAGLEYTYASFLPIRVGYSYDDDGGIKTPTFGFGVRYDWIRADFSYIWAKDTPLQGNVRASMTFKF